MQKMCSESIMHTVTWQGSKRQKIYENICNCVLRQLRHAVINKHTEQTSPKYHTACKVEYQPCNPLNSQLAYLCFSVIFLRLSRCTLCRTANTIAMNISGIVYAATGTVDYSRIIGPRAHSRQNYVRWLYEKKGAWTYVHGDRYEAEKRRKK